MTGNAPTNKAKVGGVEVAEWTNPKGVSYTIGKTYMDKKSNQWKKSNTYFAEDLDKLVQAITQIKTKKA